MNIVEERMQTSSWYEVGASSILGTRQYQQDFGYFYTGEKEVLAAVCDGMGGLEGGERASKAAVQQLVQDFHNCQNIPSVPEFFAREARRMNQAVNALKGKNGKKLNAGTTFVGVYCRENQMYWVSVGDSRIYLIRGNGIQTLNREHNYRLTLKSQLDSGMITREFYDREEKTPQADALISFLGMEEVKLVDGNQKPVGLMAGDRILLCSDGVYKSLSDSQVFAMVQDNDIDMGIAADRTTAMALRYGMRGQDNTTVILIRYLGNSSDGRQIG